MQLDKLTKQFEAQDELFENAVLFYQSQKPYMAFCHYLTRYLEDLTESVPYKHFNHLLHLIIQQEETELKMENMLKKYSGDESSSMCFMTNLSAEC